MMLQIELYVGDVEETAHLFKTVFGMTVRQAAAGWRHLQHVDNFDLMLFDPAQHPAENSHWPLPARGTGGAGIEIVICVSEISGKWSGVQNAGYECSDLYYPPWGSTEFTFRLPEGYLFRLKQPQKVPI